MLKFSFLLTGTGLRFRQETLLAQEDKGDVVGAEFGSDESGFAGRQVVNSANRETEKQKEAKQCKEVSPFSILTLVPQSSFFSINPHSSSPSSLMQHEHARR